MYIYTPVSGINQFLGVKFKYCTKGYYRGLCRSL